MPVPDFIGISPANLDDKKALREVLPFLGECELDADKAFKSKEFQAEAKGLGVKLQTPYKKEKNEIWPSPIRVESREISRRRQPIESVFSWLNDLTGFQNAQHCRSYNGSITYVLGAVVVGFLRWIERFNP